MDVGVLVEQALAPVPGGTGRYARELAAALVRHAGPGDTVRPWVAWHRDTGPARVPGASAAARVPVPGRVLARLWERGTGPAPRGGDLLHAPTLLVPPRRPGRALVVTVHDVVPWTHPDTMTPHGVRWHRAMAARAAATADAVAVDTAAVGEALVAVLPGLGPERVHVLGAGVGADLVAAAAAPGAADRRARLGLDRPYVLTLATLEPRKGLDVAVGALARLPAPGRPQLVSVGSPGWGGVDLPTAAAAAGLRPDDVAVLGRLPDADLGAVMAGALAVLVPSRSEGFGLPVAEAMAVGVPVLASDVPALAEVAGGAAQLLPVGDVAAWAGALEALVADPAGALARVPAGRRRAADHSWDAVGVRAWSLYRTLAGAGPAPG